MRTTMTIRGVLLTWTVWTVFELSQISAIYLEHEGKFEGFLVEETILNHFHPTYMGCYKKGAYGTGFEHMRNDSTESSTTVENCVAYCRENSYAFAGLKGITAELKSPTTPRPGRPTTPAPFVPLGSVCYCGNTYYPDQSTSCRNLKQQYCLGDITSACGATDNGTDVYRTCPQKTYALNTPPYACDQWCSTCPNGCFMNGTCLPGCGVAELKRDLAGGAYVCDPGCPPDLYGVGCRYDNVNCLNGKVHPINGMCMEGCLNGRNVQGIFCDLLGGSANQYRAAGPCPMCLNCAKPQCFDQPGYYYFSCPILWHGSACHGGCKPGYWGDYCGDKCFQENCALCPQSTGAPCDACTAKYYGADCDKSCTSNCGNNGCNRVSGTCNGCIDGFFGNLCDQRCNANCKSGKCYQDRRCKACASIAECVGTCTDGFFGVMCDQPCSQNCIGGCKDTDGACNGAECATGYFSPSCQTKCAAGCQDSCSKTTGVCNACKAGRFGQLCDANCSINCVDELCDAETGTCTKGCKEGATGPKCDTCVNDLWGENCNTPCSEACVIKKCDMLTGNCATTCDAGFWGNRCEKKCSACTVNKCDKEDGACRNCLVGYYGIPCDQKCGKCIVRGCDRISGACIKDGCQDGFFRLECNEACSPGCTKMCNRMTGKCDKCIEGRHDDTCNSTCPLACNYKNNNKTCDRATGKCFDGCVAGFVGDRCDQLRDTEADTGFFSKPTTMIAVGTAGAILMVGLVAAIIISVKKASRKKSGSGSGYSVTKYQVAPLHDHHSNEDVYSHRYGMSEVG